MSIHNLLRDNPIQVFNPTAGAPTGSKVTINSPVRGYVTEVGLAVNSIVTSALTLQVDWNDNSAGSTASNFVTFVTSTIGTFSSTNLYEGATASVLVSPGQPVNAGDALRFVTSGGQTSAVGATIYAIIQRN